MTLRGGEPTARRAAPGRARPAARPGRDHAPRPPAPARWVVLGNPGERVGALQRALAAAGRPPAALVPWARFLRDPAALAAALGGDPAPVVRLESPGEDAAVERALIAWGADVDDPEAPAAARIGAAAARALPDDPGRILHPRQWFLGLRQALAAVGAALPPGATAVSHPDEVAAMFDKPRAHARLAAAGVPAPRALGRAGSFEEVRARLAEAGVARAFVKLASGSAASGVVALEVAGPRVVARTTVEVVRDRGGVRLYNRARVARRDDPAEVAALVDALAREGVHLEAWVPKAGVGGRTFDLRVVVIAGRPRHVVVRTSRSPITNLHVGGDNRRGDPDAARARVGEAAWAAALAAAARAAACFPRALYAGVDVAVHASHRRCAVLEVNAFGDLLRRAVHEGQDPHAAEVAALPAWAAARAPALAGGGP